MIRKAFGLMLCLVMLPLFAGDHMDENDAEYKGVYNAVLDYVEGVYDVKPERIARSVHRDLVKYGYFKNRSGEWQGTAMNYQQLYDLAGKWNKDGKRANDKSPKKITIYDIQGKTAAAKLVAEWGQDYFNLVKEDGKWMIRQVLWQSLPKK